MYDVKVQISLHQKRLIDPATLLIHFPSLDFLRAPNNNQMCLQKMVLCKFFDVKAFDGILQLGCDIVSNLGCISKKEEWTFFCIICIQNTGLHPESMQAIFLYIQKVLSNSERQQLISVNLHLVASSTAKYFGYMQGFKVTRSIFNQIINCPIICGVRGLIFCKQL